MAASTGQAASASRTGSASPRSTKASVPPAKPGSRRTSARWKQEDLERAGRSLNVTAGDTGTKSTAASALSASPSGKRTGNKYGAVATTVDGIRFDSKAEADRYATLRLLERANELRDLRVHTTFSLKVGELLICKYECDFEYWLPGGEHVVEDVKGKRTREYGIKRNLMLALMCIRIKEIDAWA